MRNKRPTKQRQKVVHWSQEDHNEITAWWDVPCFILRLSRSRSVDICRSLAYATSSDAHWCWAPVSIDTKGKARFCHCAKPKPAIFVSQLFYALYTLRGTGRQFREEHPCMEGIFFTLCFEGQCIIASSELCPHLKTKTGNLRVFPRKPIYLYIYNLVIFLSTLK